MSHCGRDPSVIGCCGGTNETCDCECNTCACPNCSRRHEACECKRYRYCDKCKMNAEDAQGGACEVGAPDHEWTWVFA
jgi:hypothetical protein